MRKVDIPVSLKKTAGMFFLSCITDTTISQDYGREINKYKNKAKYYVYL